MSLDLRLSNLEAVVRRLEMQPNSESISSTASTTGVVPHFLAASATVLAATDEAQPWTTYDASSSIPKGAIAALIETEWAMQSPNSGDIDAFIMFRKQSGSIELVGSRGRAAGNSDNAAGANQLIVPITSSRTFDYMITDTYSVHGFDNGALIRLIGYYK
jgi:hypothetical protein